MSSKVNTFTKFQSNQLITFEVILLTEFQTNSIDCMKSLVDVIVNVILPR